MTPRSAKGKGKRLQNKIAEDIRKRFDLPEIDVLSTTMGEGGVDVKLSEAARAAFPFAVEAKNHERLNIWEAIKQAAANSGELIPLVVFKRNRSKIYVCLEWQQFLDLLEKREAT